MILNTSNAKRFYDEMGHSNFDKVVKMAELIVRNTLFDEYEMSLKYMDSKESMGYVKRFFKSFMERNKSCGSLRFYPCRC